PIPGSPTTTTVAVSSSASVADSSPESPASSSSRPTNTGGVAGRPMPRVDTPPTYLACIATGGARGWSGSGRRPGEPQREQHRRDEPEQPDEDRVAAAERHRIPFGPGRTGAEGTGGHGESHPPGAADRP